MDVSQILKTIIFPLIQINMDTFYHASFLVHMVFVYGSIRFLQDKRGPEKKKWKTHSYTNKQLSQIFMGINKINFL